MAQPVLQPDPRQLFPHQTLGGRDGPLAAGTAFTTTPIVVIVSVAGMRFLTVRGLTATANATVSFAFLRPDRTTPYTVGNPSSFTITAGTENSSGELTLNGQSWLQVTFTGAGSGTVTYMDVMGL